jgi:hypothetical protein
MKHTLIAALTALFTACPAFAVELYHCTVNNVTDGYFNPIDLKIDGSNIGGSAVVLGKEAEIGVDLTAFFYNFDGKDYLAIVSPTGPKRSEVISFVLSEVTGKLGPGTRFTTEESFGSVERPVSMICEMATPI